MQLLTRTFFALAVLGVWAPVTDGLAQDQGAGRRELLEDFEKADLKQWAVKVADDKAGAIKLVAVDEGKAIQLTGPAVPELEGKPNDSRVEIVQIDGDAALHIQGPVTSVEKNRLDGQTNFRENTVHRQEIIAVLPDFQTDTFVLEAEIKGPGGVQFGDGYRVYIGQVGDIGQLMYQVPLQGAKQVGFRYLTLSNWNRLKVVCTPSFVRVYREDSLIGDIVIDSQQSWPRGVEKSAIALFGQDVYFDNLRVSVAPSPIEASVVVPDIPPDVRPEAYAFPATADVTVCFGVLNYGATDVQFSLAVDEFNETSRRDVGQKPVPAGSPTPRRVAFELGRMKPGFYQMHMALSADGKTAGDVIWPLAVLRSMGGKKEDFVKPALPMAPYLAAMKYFRTRQPFYGNTFFYKVLDDLQACGFNALVDGYLREEHLDLCQRYGIAVWDRGRPRNHPVVLGALIGDEPSGNSLPEYVKEYKAARAELKNPDHLLLTNVIVDGAMSCLNNFFWDVIQPKHRFCRIYSGTGSTTTRDNLRLAGKTISYPGQLKNVQNYGSTPYSIIIPSFGGDTTKAYYRNPAPSELKVMMHLSLAYGAKGLFFYTWQSVHGEAFVEATCLRPLDGKLAAATEVIRKLRPHDKLIRSLEPGSQRVYSTCAWVDAVPLRSGEGTYVYAVNRDIRSRASAELSWDPECRVTRVFDLYANQSLEVFQAPFEGNEVSSRVRLDLLAGDGALLAVEVKK
jgi:hypothetical protein